MSVETGEVKWVDHGQKLPPAPEETKADAKPVEKERDVQLAQPVWSEDGTKAALQARAADNKDRWILALDQDHGQNARDGHDHDNAWVDGPGGFTLGWLKSDRTLYFQSERSGYSQLYSVSFDGGEPTGSHFRELGSRHGASCRATRASSFLTTSEADPGEEQIYEMAAEGGKRNRLTSMPGGHSIVLSPDEHWMADVYSYSNKPPELYSGELKPDAKENKLTSSPAPEFWQYPWLDTPIVTFTARTAPRFALISTNRLISRKADRR